jgi:hypothetical protein
MVTATQKENRRRRRVIRINRNSGQGAARSSEMSVSTYKTTLCHTPEDYILNNHHRMNSKLVMTSFQTSCEIVLFVCNTSSMACPSL